MMLRDLALSHEISPVVCYSLSGLISKLKVYSRSLT